LCETQCTRAKEELDGLYLACIYGLEMLREGLGGLLELAAFAYYPNQVSADGQGREGHAEEMQAMARPSVSPAGIGVGFYDLFSLLNNHDS
jgi:hypothetical protein